MTSTSHFLPLEANDTIPVQPDILVKQTVEDSKKGRDTILEYAKKWIFDSSINK
ncbi:MAG: hypothetical protein KAX05_01750 [Bacteroidales bacterium]|nr:hypothetical protein [Bacteroidales bacterium]